MKGFQECVLAAACISMSDSAVWVALTPPVVVTPQLWPRRKSTPLCTPPVAAVAATVDARHREKRGQVIVAIWHLIAELVGMRAAEEELFAAYDETSQPVGSRTDRTAEGLR